MRRLSHRLRIPLLLIFSTAGVFYWLLSSFPEKPQAPLRVVVPSIQAALRYDPADILFSYEYLFLENIYSTLTEFDNSGLVVPALAESFTWKGDKLIFKIRRLQTENGTVINADDVAFSLKRLFLLSSDDQRELREVLCPNRSLKNVDSKCDGITSNGDTLILNAGNKKSYFLNMLTAIEFSVVPRIAVGPDLRIRDMRQTTGPYYVDRDEGGGKIRLRLNRNHFHASNKIPQTIQFVTVDYKKERSAILAFKNGEADHLMTVNGSRPDELLEFIRDNPDVESHVTHRISKHILVFTKKGLKRFSAEQRRWLGRQVKSAALNISSKWFGAVLSDQFFLATGDGGLTVEDLDRISSLVVEPLKSTPLKINFMQRRILGSWSSTLQERLPGVDLQVDQHYPDLHKYANPEDEPDAFVINADGNAMEDINLISYSLKVGYFGLTKKERAKWLADYLATVDSQERLAKLRKIHFDALASGTLTPLMEFPYVAIVRKPWKLKFSSLVSNNPFWKIELQ